MADPTLKTKILKRLKEEYGQFSPRMNQVAKYILDHPADFGLDPVRVTARKAGVSTYTLVRSARHLGFDGFDDLREPFRHALVSASPSAAVPDWSAEARATGVLGVVRADAGENAVSICEASLARQSTETLEAVVDLLVNARAVHLTAVRASYAMAYYFHYVGRMALPTLHLVPRHMNSAIDELANAETGDVLMAISVTPYSRETIEACAFARARGLRLVLITDSDAMAPEVDAEHVLVVSVLSTHHFASFSGVLAVLETLLAMLVARGGAAARSRIAEYEDLRESYAAYVPAAKKR